MSKPPTLPQPLINRISEYGFARTDGVNELERINRWMLLIEAIKEYTAEYADQQAKERAEIPPGMALVPISEEQIDNIANDGMRNVSGGIYSVCVYEFARAIEKHHGITASQDSAKETK